MYLYRLYLVAYLDKIHRNEEASTGKNKDLNTRFFQCKGINEVTDSDKAEHSNVNPLDRRRAA